MNKIGIIIVLIVLTACSSYKPAKNDRLHDLILREYSNITEFDTSKIHEKAVDLVITASKFETQNKYAEAILEFQSALKYDSSAGIYYSIAKNYLKLGKVEQALENTLKSLIINDEFTYAYQLLSNIYIIQADIEKAILSHEKLVELEQTYGRKLELAKLYEYVDKNKAIALYESLMSQKENPELLLKLSALYEATGQKDKLLIAYEKLLNLNNKMPEAYELMFRFYFDNQDYKKALILLDSVQNYFIEDDLNYFYNIVGNQLLDSDSEQSLEAIPVYLQKITNSFYFDWRINMISGYLANKIGDSINVEKYFDRALKTDTIPDIPLAISFYYLDKKQSYKSLEVLSKFEGKFDSNYKFPLYKGIIYSEMDSNLLAKYELLKALRFDSSQIEIWGQLGLIYDKLQIYDSCDISYEKVLSIEPDNPLINNNFAYSLSVRGEKLDQALEMSSLALRFEPSNPSYLDTYAWIHYMIGNYEIAYDYIIKAIDSGGNSYELYEHLGYILLKLDRKNEAVESWKKSLELNPENMPLLEKFRKLKE